MPDTNKIPSLDTNSSPEDIYIKASLKYVIIEENTKNNVSIIKNSKIPGFSYIQKDINKELLFSEYKNYLYRWIREKQNSQNPDNRFIPIVDRINLNEMRVIEAYDPTKEQYQKESTANQSVSKSMYSIKHIKTESLKTISKKEK